MKNILITGCSGYIGTKLFQSLESNQTLNNIVGIDINAPVDSQKMVFHKRDIREPFDDLIDQYAIDTVVHLAYILPPLHNKALMEDININGTRNVLDCCKDPQVKHLLYSSSATAYGFHADNPVPMTEEQPLRGNDNFTYCKNKKEIEALFSNFVEGNPEKIVTILRPCFVIGPGIENPISRFLLKPLVILPSKNAPLQFIHEDDLFKAIELCLSNKIEGTYNLSGDGAVSFKELLNITGSKSIKLPVGVATLLNQLAWTLRIKSLTEMPSAGLAMVKYPWITTSEKFKQRASFQFKYSSLEAFQHFWESKRKKCK